MLLTDASCGLLSTCPNHFDRFSFNFSSTSATTKKNILPIPLHTSRHKNALSHQHLMLHTEKTMMNLFVGFLNCKSDHINLYILQLRTRHRKSNSNAMLLNELAFTQYQPLLLSIFLDKKYDKSLGLK